MRRKNLLKTLVGPDSSETYDRAYFGYSISEANPKSNYAQIRGGYDPTKHAAPELVKTSVLEFLASRKTSAKPVHFLEIGCAVGLTVEFLHYSQYVSAGIDLSEYIVTYHAVSERVVQADMYDIYAAISKVRQVIPQFGIDAEIFIYSKDVLEHVPYELIQDLLKSFASIATYQWHQINTGQYEYQAWDGDITHRIREDLLWWNAMFESAGAKNFQLVET